MATEKNNPISGVYDEIINKAKKIMFNKNKEYSKDNNVFSNFDDTSHELGITVQQSWGVFFKKHVSSILQHCKSGKVFSNESIDDRICDAINYLIFLAALNRREQENNKKDD